jgi:hypothetical protein
MVENNAGNRKPNWLARVSCVTAAIAPEAEMIDDFLYGWAVIDRLTRVHG